jgi:hypothetical protein
MTRAIIVGLDTGLTGNRLGGRWIVAGDHDDLDSGGPAFRHGRRFARA